MTEDEDEGFCVWGTKGGGANEEGDEGRADEAETEGGGGGALKDGVKLDDGAEGTETEGGGGARKAEDGSVDDCGYEVIGGGETER